MISGSTIASFFSALFLTMVAFAGHARASVGDVSGTVVRGDFDGDGTSETVVSSPEHDCGKGAVYVTDTSGNVTIWTRDTQGLLGSASCGDHFGASLAVGDFDGDGYDDLAVGIPGADDAGPPNSGAVHVIYGSASGLTTTGDQLWHQDTTGVQEIAEQDDHFGDVLTTGDFNCDGFADLVVGVPREEMDSEDEAGAVHVLYGSSGGVTSVDDLWIRGESRLWGTSDEGNHFGAALAAGNFNGLTTSGPPRPCEDLAVGVPNADRSASLQNIGQVHVLYGSSSGLSTTGQQLFSQLSSGMADPAEPDDRFGAALTAVDRDGDGYVDLAVHVPGDACVPDHGVGLHVLYGSSSGITTSGNHLDCHTYGCSIAEHNRFGCHSYSLPVHATDDGDHLSMFVGDDVVWGRGGDDVIRGDHGDDVLFGGPGNDLFFGGPGVDIQIGGSGDDIFVIDVDCHVQPGEVIDGGPGNDTIRSHLSQSQLEALGLTIVSIEQFVTIGEASDSPEACVLPPYQDGPMLRPKVVLSWQDLTKPSSVFSTSSGVVTLLLENITDVAVDVELALILRVMGAELVLRPSSFRVNPNTVDTFPIDLHDFIPSWVDPQQVDRDVLEIPTSAYLAVHAKLSVGQSKAGSSFAPLIFGHLEEDQGAPEGWRALIYRRRALAQTYYHGDLAAWRAQAPAYGGSPTLIGRFEAGPHVDPPEPR